MTTARPIALPAKRAAETIGLAKSEFLRLVEKGILPKPKRLGDRELWSYADLEAVFSGKAMDEDDWTP